MLTARKNNKRFITRFFFLAYGSIGLTGCAGVIQTAGEALIKMQAAYSAIVSLVISIAYLSGALFVIKAIFSFKQYGEQRTMMSSQVTIRAPLTYLSVGVAMLYLPSMISIFSNAAFSQPNVALLGYGGSGSDTIENIRNSVYGLVQVVGLISILRALFIASNPHPGGGQGGFGKAVVHFCAGLVAVNIAYVMSVLENFV